MSEQSQRQQPKKQPDSSREASAAQARPASLQDESSSTSEANANISSEPMSSNKSGGEPRGVASAAQAQRPGEGSDANVDYAAKIAELDRVIEGGQFNAQKSTREEREEFYRKRNALYSQRKYYRKKLKIQKLEEERDSLIQKNNKVRSENQDLERTLAWAIEKVKIHLLEVSRAPPASVAATAGNPLLAQASISTAGDPSSSTASDLILSRLLGPPSSSLVNPNLADLLSQQQQVAGATALGAAGGATHDAARLQSLLLQSLGATAPLRNPTAYRSTALERVLAQSTAGSAAGVHGLGASLLAPPPQLEQLLLQQALLQQQQQTGNPQGLVGTSQGLSEVRGDESSRSGLSLQDALQGIGGEGGANPGLAADPSSSSTAASRMMDRLREQQQPLSGLQQQQDLLRQLGAAPAARNPERGAIYGAASLAGALQQQQESSLFGVATSHRPSLHSVTPLSSNNNHNTQLAESQQQPAAALRQVLPAQPPPPPAAAASVPSSDLLRAVEEQKAADQGQQRGGAGPSSSFQGLHGQPPSR